MMEYTALSTIMGESMGKVIFQKDSQAVAPSIFAASYSAGEMPMMPEMNSRICKPDCQLRSNTPLTMPISVATNSVFMPISSRILSMPLVWKSMEERAPDMIDADSTSPFMIDRIRPLPQITGRKNTERKKVRPLKLPDRMTAIISEKARMITTWGSMPPTSSISERTKLESMNRAL